MTTRSSSRNRIGRIAREPRRKELQAQIVDGPIFSTLLKLALPTMIAIAAQTGVRVAEGCYVGLYGTEALAGSALVFPHFMLMLTMSGGGFGNGVASTVTRAIGSARRHHPDAMLFHAIVLGVVIGGLFTVGLQS